MPGRLPILIAAAAIAGRAPAQPCEPYWSNEFPAAQLEWSVLGLAVFDDGSGTGPAVYAGGLFDSADGVTLNRVAKLGVDGWSPLGAGLSGAAWAMTGHDDGSGTGPCLYVAGSFSSAGGVVANDVARWDGSAWSALGDGIDSLDGSAAWAWALAEFDDGSGDGPALYVGGYFSVAGEVAANNIAKWDGAAWSSLGDGMDAHVNALHVFDDGSGPALYAGGGFTSAGGLPAEYIARWDGISWSPVGGGLAGNVGDLTVFDDGLGGGPALYATEHSTSEGDVTVRVKRWDGTAWSPVGEFNDSITALTVFDDGARPALYAAGLFTEVGGVAASRVAKWDGVSWVPLGAGIGYTVQALVPLHDGPSAPALYAGGWFSSAGGIDAPYCATWDGTQWSSVGRGVQGGVRVLQVVDDLADAGPLLYAAGGFTRAGGIPAANIAAWDGQSWSQVGGGIGTESMSYPHGVHDLVVYDEGSGEGSMLCAGGRFIEAGGVEVSNIASWDGAAWSSLGTGVHGTVYALEVLDEGAESGPCLIAAGYVREAGKIPVNNVARWDGVTWSAVGAGTNGLVRALAVFDDGSTGPALYAAGEFTIAGEIDASGIARWDGTSWSALGAGIDVGGNYTVYALTVYDDGEGAALYAGGIFLTASGISVNGLARWDGSSWSSVGGGVILPIVYSLTVFDDGVDTRSALYAGGQFDIAGGTAANSVARWNGAFWSGLGEGITDDEYAYVQAMAVFDDGSGDGPALVVGGYFDTAGGSSSANFGKWVPCRSKSPPPFRVCHYDVTIIEGPEGLRSEGLGINERGDVVGRLGWTSSQAFLWTAQNGLMPLANETAATSYQAFDLNEDRQITGVFTSSQQGSRGLIYDKGHWTILEPTPGSTWSWARAISNSGSVVGCSGSSAVVWHDGIAEVLDLPGGWGDAWDINDEGVIVGGFYNADFEQQSGFILPLGGPLISIPPIPGGYRSEARAVNDANIVAGRGEIPNPGDPKSPVGLARGFMWDDGRFTVFEPLTGHNKTTASDVNNDGAVVGVSMDTVSYPPFYVAVVWHNGVATILNDVVPWDLGLSIEAASAINDQGQIVGTANSWRGTTAVLLTPVDRPLGDINGNCRVDVDDLVILLFEWGQSDSPADLDGDGVVGIRDFLLLLANWRV